MVSRELSKPAQMTGEQLARCSIFDNPTAGLRSSQYNGLSQDARKSVRGIGGFAIVLGVGIFLLVGTLVYNSSRASGVTQAEEKAWLYGFVAGVAVPLIVNFLVKQARVSTLDQKMREQQLASASSAALSTKNATEAGLRRLYAGSITLANDASTHLSNASAWIRAAESEYAANAYAPFWDAVETAAVNLGAYNDAVRQIGWNAEAYYRDLSGHSHTFPPFPVHPNSLPSADPVIAALNKVVRQGQTNFQFANIWEHRATRNVLIAGFNTLAGAVANLGGTINESVNGLRQSVSSDVARVVDEQRRSRDAIDDRLRNQNEILTDIRRQTS